MSQCKKIPIYFSISAQLTWYFIYYSVRLSKRRKVGSSGMPSSNSRLIVKHRSLNEQEMAILVIIYKIF